MMVDFLPHGYCMRWEPGLVGTHVIADALIAVSYFCIPGLLWFGIKKRTDIKFNWVFIPFLLFILACGVTHVMDIVTLWAPLYWLAGFFKVVTAVASMVTVAAIYQLMPQIRHVLTPQQMHVRDAQRLQTVLDGATNVSVIATNTDGMITIFNSGAENLLGYTSEELVGRNTLGIFHLASEIAARGLELTQELGKPVQGFDVFVEKAKNGGHDEREWTYVRKDGSHFTVNLVVTALKDPDGAVGGFVGVAMDVSARKAAEAASKISDAHFRLIAETVGDYALLMLDAAGHVISWNIGAERMKGYTAAEVIGQHFSIFYAPEDIEKGHPDEELRIAAKLGRYAEEGWRVRKNGSRYLADVVIAAIYDEAGKACGFAKVVHDITERKRTEERFELVVEASPSAMIMIKGDGLITLVNSQTEKLFGYGRHELVGRSIEMLLPERFRGHHGALVDGFFGAPSARAMAAGRELYGVRKDGSEVPVEIGLNPINASSGKFVLASIIDITARKQTEIALRETEINFRTMVEAVPQMVWITRADGFNIYFSQKWMDYTGLTLEESLGHGWNKPFHPEDRQRAWEAWQEATNRTDGSYRIECRLRRADGAYRWFLILGVRQLNLDGTTQKWFGTCTDITLAKVSEAGLKAANHELEQFAYVASHDLKAPLRAIQKSAKWLEEDLEEHLTDETREHLKVLRGRVKRMDKLLDDLLAYARIGRSTDSRYEEGIKGDVLMEDVLALLPLEGFLVEVSASFANIEVCRMPLQHILMNLIGNGIKHHHQKTGKIGVTVEDAGDFYSFAVKDDGPGIAAQFHDQVFEMFRTLRPRDQVEGSGMGLAMVRKHIEVAGGRLRLESARGEGSTFRFTWPKRHQLRKELA